MMVGALFDNTPPFSIFFAIRYITQILYLVKL